MNWLHQLSEFPVWPSGQGKVYEKSAEILCLAGLKGLGDQVMGRVPGFQLRQLIGTIWRFPIFIGVPINHQFIDGFSMK